MQADTHDSSELTSLRQTVTNLTEQLHALYAEREESAARDDETARTVASLVEQLHALYADGEGRIAA
jgi:hypothetical protein